MRQISYWAKHHVWQSRLLIGIIYILLNVLGIFIGKLLTEINVTMPGWYFSACIFFTATLWILYPHGNSSRNLSRSMLYTRRKMFDFSLGVVTFLMIIYVGNNWQHIPIAGELANAAKITPLPKDSAINNSDNLLRHFIANIKSKDIGNLNQRQKSRIIKDQVKKIEHERGLSTAAKIGLIFLSVVVALGLLYGLAALSCSISCNGSETLAIIVGVGGAAAIIFFLTLLIIRILRKPRVKNEKEIPER